MTDTVNTRELALDVLLRIEKEQVPGHVALGQILEKYQFLPKQDRAFVTRLCEGTIEYQIQNDYVINQYSKVKIHKCKPVIRELLRMSVYQIRFMDSIPDSAVVNEAVKLAKKRGFFALKGFVNGVLRSMSAKRSSLCSLHVKKILSGIFLYVIRCRNFWWKSFWNSILRMLRKKC